jgi:integrase
MANRKVRGWLRPRERADGKTWLWCYQRLRESDGEMVENSVPLGLVADIGDDEPSAWLRVAELDLVEKYLKNNFLSGKPTFGELCGAYIRDGLPRRKDGHRKTKGTIETSMYHINNLILPRWKNVIAGDMKPVAIENWLFDLHDDYVWETCSKTAGLMSQVFRFVDDKEIYAIRNPLEKVTIPASEEDHEEVKIFSPEQSWALANHPLLPLAAKYAVLLVATTGIRTSENLGLIWKRAEWAAQRIHIRQTFRRGEIQNRTKTKASKDYVPMCEDLATFLTEWRQQSPYNKDEDFIFASPKLNGKQPLWGQTLNENYVKPAAVALGLVAKDERFGWHRLRHSLATWVEKNTPRILRVAQRTLRHSDSKMTERYVHPEFEEALEAQTQYIKQMLAGETPARSLLGGPSGWVSGQHLTTKTNSQLVSDYAVSR